MKATKRFLEADKYVWTVVGASRVTTTCSRTCRLYTTANLGTHKLSLLQQLVMEYILTVFLEVTATINRLNFDKIIFPFVKNNS